MRLHLAGDVLGNKKNYHSIVFNLRKLGHQLVTDYFLKATQDQVNQESSSQAESYSKNCRSWIRKADVVIFEITKPSINIGYEVGLTLQLNKPVILLTDERVKSSSIDSIRGVKSEKIQEYYYNQATLGEVLAFALKNAQESSNVRFNFFISPEISSYLDWIVKFKKISRSIYLRKIIQDDMQKNKEYARSIDELI